MNSAQILEELLGLFEAGGVALRQEPLGGSGGGLCSVKGQWILFVDTQAPSEVMAQVCAEAVPQVIDIEQIYIKPEVREFIEYHGVTKKE
jgi:hypothetical protein